MKRVLYVHNRYSRFVAYDETVLKTRCDVRTLDVKRRPASLLNAGRAAFAVDIVVAWFASWHSLPSFLAAKLHGIPRLLITGGYDVACEPDIPYGLRCGGLPRWFSSAVFKLTNRALTISDYSTREALANTPLTAAQTVCVPLGVPDTPAFDQPTAKQAMVLTIGDIDALTAYRKGIRPFVEAAALLPDVPFVVVGKARDKTIDTLKQIATPNVEFKGFVSDAELIDLQQRAKVYVQASQHEGFGLSLAESMLARCVPVVTRYGALPEVAGNTGVYVDDLAPPALADAIRTAINAPPELGESARQHILSHFAPEKRAAALYAEIDRLLSC